jgi:hypothetical protein
VDEMTNPTFDLQVLQKPGWSDNPPIPHGACGSECRNGLVELPYFYEPIEANAGGKLETPKCCHCGERKAG